MKRLMQIQNDIDGPRYCKIKDASNLFEWIIEIKIEVGLIFDQFRCKFHTIPNHSK